MWGMSRIGALWAIVLASQCCNLGQSYSTDIPCPTQVIICSQDDTCSVCLEYLRSLVDLTFSTDQCEALYSDVCMIVEEAGCDSTNEALLDLAQCVAEDLYSCSDFTNCEDATSTPAPGSVTVTSAPTGAPTMVVVAATPAPTEDTQEEEREAEETDPASNGGGSGRVAALDTAVLLTFSLVLASGVAVLFG